MRQRTLLCGMAGARLVTSVFALALLLPAGCFRDPDPSDMVCSPQYGCPSGYACVSAGSENRCCKSTDGLTCSETKDAAVPGDAAPGEVSISARLDGPAGLLAEVAVDSMPALGLDSSSQGPSDALVGLLPETAADSVANPELDTSPPSAPQDAGRDLAPEAAYPPPPEAGADSLTLSSPDLAPDSTVDSVEAAPPDSSPIAVPDAGPDLGPDLGPDSSPDVICGAVNQACCANDTCGAGSLCSNRSCVACGGAGQPCCTTGTCSAGNACNQGTCQSGCVINSTFYPADYHPSACLVCQPAVHATEWSNDDGASCGSNAVCASGTCQSGCFIGGVLYHTNDRNPSNPCEVCQPYLDTTGWSPAADGPTTGCTGGAYCTSGACQIGCWLGGAYVAPDVLNSGNRCQKCDPASPTAWSPANDGQACNGTGTCTHGACAYPLDGGVGSDAGTDAPGVG